MPKIETEEQFLDLAEKFQKDYCLLRNHVVNTQFVDLSDDLREKPHALCAVHFAIFKKVESYSERILSAT